MNAPTRFDHSAALPDETGPEPLSRQTRQQEIAKAFRPVMRGFMLPVAMFYSLVIVPNFILSAPFTALNLSGPAVVTVLAALYIWKDLRSDDASFQRLEVLGAMVLLLIYTNCCKLILVDYNALNLTYFLLLFIITAAVAISVRLIVAMCSLTLITTLTLAYKMGPDIMNHVLFGAIAAAFAAVGLAVLMRAAIMTAVKSKLLAERLRARAEIHADYDALTGLPNRRRFFAAVEGVIAGESGKDGLIVGILDLDGFKPVNDLYGHAIGDELLFEVARRLRNACPSADFVARLGGDEFALAIQRPLDDVQLRQCGTTLCEALREPFVISGICISISGSIGFAHYPASGQTMRQIYERADHALYRAKRDSRGDVVIFLPEHESELSDIGRFEQALRTADLQRELCVVFQPQHDLMTGRTSGFEALARWNSPSLGPVSPVHFIAAAERSGIMERMTGILVQKSLAAAAAAWPEDISLSVNLSGLDLMSERSIANIVQIVSDSAIRPSRVTFEITETAIMRDFERARTSLLALSRLGCKIALDDFGSGYSSFAYIHRFPLDRVKTDRSFVTRRKEDAQLSGNIFRAIADLCANLGVECLAEGVETEDELQTVRAAGIRYIQGYYFGRPMPVADIAAYLANESSPPAIAKLA